MTTEEKLQHFMDICMEDARTKSARLYDEYKAALEQSFQEHQEDASRRLTMQLEGESEKIGREINKKLALAQINIRRDLSRRQEELKDLLFVEVRGMLAGFMATPEYAQLLDRQISEARKVAGTNELIVYMDPADEPLLQKLSAQNQLAVKLSAYPFSGGTRAVIPAAHILIDNSFETKLAEARRSFQFDLGGTDHE